MRTLVASEDLPPRSEHQNLLEALERLREKAARQVQELSSL